MKQYECKQCEPPKVFNTYAAKYSHCAQKHGQARLGCKHCSQKFHTVAQRNMHYYNAVQNPVAAASILHPLGSGVFQVQKQPEGTSNLNNSVFLR
jgi:hypothetical protein